MRVLVVLAHPNAGSFNHAIAETVRQTLTTAGHAVDFHDLYAEGFDPVLPGPEVLPGGEVAPAVTQACEALRQADGLVFIHPNWWGQPPAILTGWIDRVFRPDVAYRFLPGDQGEGVPEGLLRARGALVFNTANTAEDREQKLLGDPLDRIWKHCILHFCGVQHVQRRMFTTVVDSSPAQRDAWLQETAALTGRTFPRGA
jgi:NAD(P)H dehydrogenase (quinone)